MLKKTLVFVLTFIVIFIGNFFIPRLMPGDPFAYTGTSEGDELTSIMSPEEMEKQKAYYGLDKPIGEQFVTYVRQSLTGDLGQSIYFKQPVGRVIMDRLPWTLYIILTSLVISMVIGIVLALISIHYKKADGALYGASSVLAEIPAFLIGILLLFLIAAKVKAIPLSGNVTPFKEYKSIFEFLYDAFIHSVLPIAAMVIVTAPRFYFTARSSFLTVQHKKYILNAKAKGLNKNLIRFKYILLNGIFPIIASFFLSVGMAIGGTILIENVFAYPGLGKLLRDAVTYRDYALIQGIFLLSTIIVLISSYVSDIINNFIWEDKT